MTLTVPAVQIDGITPDEGLIHSLAFEFVDAMERLSNQHVGLHEIPSLTLVRIEIDPYSHAAKRMEKVLGVEFPKAPGEVTGDKNAREIFFGQRQVVACLWVHEDTFLVVTQVDSAKLGRALNTALGTAVGLVLDVSFNRAVLELSGDKSASVLERTVSFEENVPKFFDQGMAWRCSVGASELMLWRIGEDRYLMVPRNSHTPVVVVSVFDAMEEITGS